MVNYFSGANGRFEVVDGGSGSKVVSSSSIVIDRSELPAAGDEVGALRFAGLLAHELGTFSTPVDYFPSCSPKRFTRRKMLLRQL